MSSGSFQKEIALRMARPHLRDSGLIGPGSILKNIHSVVLESDIGDSKALLG